MDEKPLAPQTNPVMTSPNPLAKPFIAVLIVAIFVIIGVAFYFIGKSQGTVKTATPTPSTSAQPTSQKTAWSTYSNTKYNYEIQYPSDWTMNEYAGSSKAGASFNEAVSIAAGKTLLNYAKMSLEEYAKMAGSEIENRNELASFKKITTTSGIVGYTTTWMVQGRAINGQPPTGGESESLPITYFEIPGNKSELIRVELLSKEHLDIYEKMLATVKITAPLTPLPTIDESAVLKNVIKKYISLKHKSDENALTITVSKIEGDYAQGGASSDGGGGMWFASKKEGAWMLIWDGNGTIECAYFSQYPDFPTSMLPECYDSAKQDIVKR